MRCVGENLSTAHKSDLDVELEKNNSTFIILLKKKSQFEKVNLKKTFVTALSQPRGGSF